MRTSVKGGVDGKRGYPHCIEVLRLFRVVLAWKVDFDLSAFYNLY